MFSTYICLKIAPGAVTTSKIATGAVTSGDIADSAITSTKPAESSMKRVTLLYNPAGNALGWDPDNVDASFIISEPAISSDNSASISIEVRDQGRAHSNCDVVDHTATTKTFSIECE